MYFDIIKNPIVLGVLAGAVTYLYLWWSNNKKKPKDKKEPSLFFPIIVAVVVAIVAYGYFSSGTCNSATIVQEQIKQTNVPGSVGKNYQFEKSVSSESPASFHLISRGVNIPNTVNVPDVFIETY